MSRKSQKSPQKADKYLTESIKVEKFIPGGQALGTLSNGKKIFLWNALPGETVTKIKVTKEKSSFVEGVAEDIVQKSKYRIRPEDECYLSTSPWQILSETYENQQKIAILREIFRQHDIQIPENFQIFSDNQFYHYRNKMEYALYYSHEDQKIYPAFHARGSHRKIPIKKSSLERPEIWQRAEQIINELNQKGEEARKYQSLLLRCSQTGAVSGGLLENGQPHPVFPALEDQLCGVKYSYSPNGFFQINLPVYESALKEIAKHIRSSSVLDLYSGVGTIGYSIASMLPETVNCLTLVECNASACKELFANRQNFIQYLKSNMSEKTSSNLNHPQENARPIQAKTEDVLEYVAPDQTIIIDPPRAGCLPEVIEHFLEIEPECIIYLSCNPATQARDIKKLLEKYQISFFQPYNFFPRTPHIENLIVLNRK